MRSEIYNLIGTIFALVVGLLAFSAAVMATLDDTKFLGGRYLKWLGCAILFAALSPILYQWGSPTQMTLADAYLLRVQAAGWTYTLMAYLGLAGLVLGALVAGITIAAIKMKSRSQKGK